MKKIEALLKNILLRILLAFLRKREDENEKFNSSSKILMIRLNRIGDALVVTPFLSVIKNNIGCTIHVLAGKHNHFIFQNNPDVDQIILLKKGIREYIRLIKSIKNERYSAVIDLHDDISTTVSFLLALSGIKRRIGLSKGNDSVYTKTIGKKNPAQTHVIERIMALAEVFNIKVDYKNVNIKYLPVQSSIEKAENVLCRIFNQDKFLVGINISAGSYARLWDRDNYLKLIEFLSAYEVNILILCSTRDIQYALPLAKGNNIFYSPSFDEFAAIISKLDFLFTPDTSAVHLASAYEIPVFGLYVKYKTDDMIWYPFKSDFDYVLTTEPNLKQIRFEDVIVKLKPFLEKHLYERNTSL